MDEDEGQQAAEYISQQQMDDYYDRLGEEMDKQARAGNIIIGVVFVILIICAVAWYFYGGQYAQIINRQLDGIQEDNS